LIYLKAQFIDLAECKKPQNNTFLPHFRTLGALIDGKPDGIAVFAFDYNHGCADV
jgi:hypothetical protein